MANSAIKKNPKKTKVSENSNQIKSKSNAVNEMSKTINQRTKRVSKPNRLFLDNSIWKNDGDIECSAPIAKKQPKIVSIKAQKKRPLQTTKISQNGESDKKTMILAKKKQIERAQCQTTEVIPTNTNSILRNESRDVKAKPHPKTKRTLKESQILPTQGNAPLQTNQLSQNGDGGKDAETKLAKKQPVVSGDSCKGKPVLTNKNVNRKVVTKKGQPFTRLRFEVDCADLVGSVDLNGLVKFLKENLVIDGKKNNSEKIEVKEHNLKLMIMSKGNLQKKCVRDQTYKFLGRMNRTFRIVSKNKRSYKIIKKDSKP